ncbi:MAG: hypothetical protein JW889_16245 [Verrucomicrobia bacterium]|nr:hypothetical protein [Verrucomicrobiota bacterium]
MPRKTLNTALITVCVLVILAATVPGGRTADAQGLAAEQTKRNCQAALMRPVTLQITAGPDGGQPTVETAIAAICQQVGVPYQAGRSRAATNGKVTAAVTPVDLNNVVAADAIRAFCADAGLVPELDANGVYIALPVEPVQNEPESPPVPPDQPRRLSNLQRTQIGVALNITGKTLLDKKTDETASPPPDVDVPSGTRVFAETTTQQIQVEMSMTTTRTLPGVSVTVTVFGYRHTLKLKENRRHRAPKYREDKETIVLGAEELQVGDLPAGQNRKGRSSVVTASFTDAKYEVGAWGSVEANSGMDQRSSSGPYRSGTEYCGWIVDVYSNGQLIKVITSNKALFHKFGRDPSTGFTR